MNGGPGTTAVALAYLLGGGLIGLFIATFPGWIAGKTTARRHRKEARTLRINIFMETKGRRITVAVVGFVWLLVLASTAVSVSSGAALVGYLALALLGLAVANYAAFFIGYTASAERLAHRWPSDTD